MKTNLFSQRTFFPVKSVRTFLLFFFLLTGVQVWGQLETLACPEGTIVSNQMTFNTTNFTIVHAKGSDANFAEYTPWRVYTNNTVTFTGGSGVQRITSIVITATTNAYASAAASGSVVVTSGTGAVNATASGTTVTLSVTGSNVKGVMLDPSAQTRWSSITINYLAASTATPTLTVTPASITALNYIQGSGPSAAQSYNLKGADLTSGVTVTAPANFEVSRTASGTYANNITYTAAEGNVSAGQTVYVRLKSGLTANNYTGSVTNVSTGASQKDVSVTGSVTAPATYTLTYNGNDNTSDASTVPANVSFTGGQNPGVILATAGSLVKIGYTLASWYSIPNGVISGVINTPGSNYGPAPMPNNNVALYARWGFSVAYNNNGGLGTISSQTGYYNGTTGVRSGTLTLNDGSSFTRPGYTFSGWKTTAAGTTVDYNAGAVYTHTVSDAAVTLYAHWIKNAPTFNVSPASLSGFNYVESNGSSLSQSFTLSGSDLENTDTDPVELVTIDDKFEIAESASGPYSHAVALPSTYIGANKIIYVRLKAGQTAANYTDTVLISGGSALEAGFAEVSLSGSVSACLAPTAQSSVSSFGSVTSFGMTINVTSGNGVGRIIKINTTNTFADPISSNALPTADAVYSGTGEQIIYAGTGNSVAVTGLSPSTTYWVRVYEYNICSGNYTYSTTTSTNNPRSQITACDVPINPNGDIELDNPYCGSADLVYELGSNDFTNLAKGVTYYWQTAANGTSLANPLVFAPNAAVSNTYNVTVSRIYYVRAYNGNCWSATSYATGTAVNFISAINVTSQPANQNAVAGSAATFTVTASNVSSYQWQVSTNSGTTWTDVAGATSTSYTTPVTTLAMNGYRYRVRLSNSCGNVTSNAGLLTVITGPCLSENFNATTTPSGWSATNVSWTEYSGGGSFNANNGTLTTPKLSRPSKVTFDLIRTTNATAKTLFVKISTTGQNTGFNTTIATYTHSNTTSGGTTPIDLDLSDYSTEDQVWIRLEKSSSTTSPWRFDDFEVFCAPSCTPAPITAFPTSGPAGTIVTITGSSFTSGSMVKFGTVATPAQFISANQLKVTVPATADGNIFVDTTLECDSETAFTLIKEDITACEPLTGSSQGGTYASDLIIYEVYDENGGSGGNITIYNGTNATADLSNYDVYRAGDYGGTYSDYATISGDLAPGSVAVIGVSGSKCGYTAAHGTINGGFNDNDGFRLMKGSVVIDDVKAPNYSGYYLKRKNEYLAPKTVFADNEWTTESLGTDQCLPVNEVGQVPGIRTAPIVTVQPIYSLTCDVVNASLTLTATEGLIGGNALTYQWYVLQNTGTWTAITDGGVYSGATTTVLNINDVAGLNNYQYYCQVRENTQTCYTATTATQIKEAGNTWASNVWSNGMPVLGSKVIISGTYDTQANGILNVCDLTVNSGGSMRVKPNFPITVKKKIINNNTTADSFVVESDANLIQTENIANEGKIKVERSVTDMNNNAATAIDYVYWSSPVSGQVIKGSSGFSPNTPAAGYMQYNESNDKFVVTNDATFLTGKGYAIRAENVLSNGYNKTYNFAGVPNNGDVSSPVLNKSAGTDKGYNLVGNPYPSNIDFDQFHALNSAKIYATAFFWTNNSYTAQQLGSGYAGNNYAIYNITGGVPATYDEGNPNYSIAPNGKIKVGQGFIVQSKIAGALDFKNSIRVADDGTFYQKASTKNRFWLTMKSPNNLVNTILVGYVSGATDNYETDFDGELFAIGSDSFYSVLGAKKLAIQGRSENFSTDDVVALGNVFSTNGTYTIKLHTTEGNFNNNQTIYLRDKVLNKYINLRNMGSYTFEATKGTNNTRFEIVYKDETLTANENKKSEFIVYKDGQNFVIRSSNKLGKVEVFDMSGRLMKSLTSNQKVAIIDSSDFPNGLFIIKAENSGEVKTRKINK